MQALAHRRHSLAPYQHKPPSKKPKYTMAAFAQTLSASAAAARGSTFMGKGVTARNAVVGARRNPKSMVTRAGPGEVGLFARLFIS
jgi:hypothetical protein